MQEIADYSRLPVFRSGKVFDLPYESYRPDYLGVMNTLDVIEELFG